MVAVCYAEKRLRIGLLPLPFIIGRIIFRLARNPPGAIFYAR
jgi:hypothetical protein